MKRFILFPALMISSLITAQVRVVDNTLLPAGLQVNAVPDVNGKVLINGDLVQAAHTGSVRIDTIFIMPGWPLSAAGSCKLGGVYCNMDVDYEKEVLFNMGQKTYAWNINGTPVTGWPKTFTNYADGPPAFGDIDGDGQGEIVVTTRTAGTANSGNIYAWELDGTTVTGFPVTLGGGITNNPCLADLDNDGAMEIIVPERNYPNGRVGVYHGNGNMMSGWPQQMDYIPGSACSAGDIDNDGYREVICQSYYKIWVWNHDGTVISGFPYTPPLGGVFSYSTPVLADINDDGYRDILCGDHSLSSGNGLLHILDHNGVPLPGWPKALNYWIYSPASVGDIDHDGELDVAIGDQVLSTIPVNQLAAWSADGTPLPGFPVTGLDAINCQTIIADLDGDDQVELLNDDNTGNGTFHAYNHDGTVWTWPGWPLTLTGQPFYMNPFVADLDRNGTLEMVVSSSVSSPATSYAYIYTTYVEFDSTQAYTSMLQYNPWHDGTYGSSGTTGITVNQGVAPQLSVLPNPSADQVRIEVPCIDAGSVHVAIMDIHGQKIVEFNKMASSRGIIAFDWDGGNEGGIRVKPGIYLIRTVQGTSLFTGRCIRLP